MAQNTEKWGRAKARERYAEGGKVFGPPALPELNKIPTPGSRGQIRDSSHLQRLMRNADSDEAMQRIKRRGERQGLDTSSWGAD